MTNLDISIDENRVLTIRVDLNREFHDSKRGRSVIIASSEGNVVLHDGEKFLDARLNMTISRKKSREELARTPFRWS